MTRKVNAERQEGQPANFAYGYAIPDSCDAAKIAAGVATEIVREALDLGTEIRSWVIETRSKTHHILKIGETISTHSLSQEQVSEALAEVLFWENEITHTVRTYFGKISDLMGRLRVLNPPLTTRDIDLYGEVLLADRRSTLAILEPLSEVIDKISKLKTLCWFESAPNDQPGS